MPTCTLLSLRSLSRPAPYCLFIHSCCHLRPSFVAEVTRLVAILLPDKKVLLVQHIVTITALPRQEDSSCREEEDNLFPTNIPLLIPTCFLFSFVFINLNSTTLKDQFPSSQDRIVSLCISLLHKPKCQPHRFLLSFLSHFSSNLRLTYHSRAGPQEQNSSRWQTAARLTTPFSPTTRWCTPSLGAGR